VDLKRSSRVTVQGFTVSTSSEMLDTFSNEEENTQLQPLIK